MPERDDEIYELRRQLEAANKREESLRRDQNNTSYYEYLRLCHEELFMTLKVQDKARPSSGGTTDVTGKHYPLTLRPWEEFLDKQRLCQRIIEETVSGFLFPSRNDVHAIARASNKRPVASEEDLRTFEHLAVEDPVENVFAAFGPRSRLQSSGRELDCESIIFENHPLSLMEPDDDDEIVVKPAQGQSGSNKRMALPRKVLRKRGPDRWAIRTRLTGEKCTAFPGEYKAAHKIPAESFQKAMCKQDLFTRVILGIASGKVSTDGETHLQEQIEATVAKALAQTFHYMVHLGSSYGYLTAGKSLIFLHIQDDPTVLYYHVSQPETDAQGQDGTIDPLYTAVAQLAAFCLQTCRDLGKSNLWKEKATLRLKEWPHPYLEMRGGTTEEESPQSTRSTSSYSGSITAAEKLTVKLQQSTRASCNPQLHPDVDDPSDDESAGGGVSGQRYRLPLPRGSEDTGSSKRKDITPDSDNSRSSEELELENRPYCTQDCLRGLKRNGLLDERCPNVKLHRRAGSSLHPINAVDLRDLLRKDLTPLVHRLCSIKPLDGDGKYGSTGALFKLSSSHYGYTFVGKGTFASGIGSLEHELRVYMRLEPLQSHYVAVCLGSISLDTPWRLAATDIVHMLLMAWAGDTVTVKQHDPLEVVRLQELLLAHGVIHNDLRPENLLWNPDCKRLFLVDFNLATILQDQNQLQRRSRKRKRHLRDLATVNCSKRATTVTSYKMLTQRNGYSSRASSNTNLKSSG
ncbi:hypothetical protein H9Q69_013052 [Fusarium xylarioides]|nr:hypothetical protein H9Q69_013052 [Fusarium xylarioides]